MRRWKSDQHCCASRSGGALNPRRISILVGLAASALLVATVVSIPCAWAKPRTGPAILLLSDNRGGFGFVARVDPTHQTKLREAGKGYQWDGANYRDLAWETLRQFNVVVMTYPPSEGDAEGRREFSAALPLLRRFLEEGGGVILFSDENYNSYQPLNEFLMPLGAEVLPENVVDEATLYRQPRYFQEHFGHTNNILPHPVTEGVRELWYPLAWSPTSSGATEALKVDGDWQVVVRGNPTAYSHRWKAHEVGQRTYESAPPMVAVRQVGRGRIAVFPTRVHNYLQQGYHLVYEGICLERGDGARLLTNLYDWLAEPSLAAGTLGGFVEPPPAPPAAPKYTPEQLAEMDIYTRVAAMGGHQPVTQIVHERRPVKDFVGVIGVYSSFSKGFGTVADYCQRARELGYQYLAFTEDFADMTEEKWNQLVAECRKALDADFVAIPGIEIRDIWGNTFMSLDLPKWVDPAWLAKDRPLIENWPGYYFGLSHGVHPFLAHFFVAPRQGFHPPWFMKFYAGLELFSYNHGNIPLGDCLDWYLQCQANDYNLIPIVAHRIHTPNELPQVSGYKTHVLAEKASDVPKAFRYHWYVPRSVYVSSGPRIVEFDIENGRSSAREEEWRLYIDVESDVPLKEVRLYDRKETFRCFRPSGKRFHTEVGGYHDRQRFFVLIAEDVNGGQAVSSALYTSDLRQSTYMCTDLQNTLNTMVTTDRQGKLTYMGVTGHCVTGWDSMSPPLLVSNSDVLPESGIEYGFGGWQGSASHYIPYVESAIAQRDMVFDSGDCNTLDNLYYMTFMPTRGGYPTPTRWATSRARFISFTPRPYSQNLMLVEQEIRLLKDLPLNDRPGPDIQGVNFAFQANSFPYYCFVGGETRRGRLSSPKANEVGPKKRAELASLARPLRSGGEKKNKVKRGERTDVQALIPPGGYAAVFPDFWGSLAVYPLDEPCAVHVGDGSMELGWELGNQTVKAGTVLKQRWLVVRGKFGEEDEAEFDRIRDLYGLDGRPGYEVTVRRGEVKDTRFALTLQADGYAAAASISSAPMPNGGSPPVRQLADSARRSTREAARERPLGRGPTSDLPVIVEGLCDRWDAGLLDYSTKTLRRIGVFGENSSGYLTVPIDRGRATFAVGNLLTCDDPAVRLSLFHREGRWVIEAHNPNARAVVVRVRVAMWLRGVVPPFDETFSLAAGETRRVED